MDTNNGTTCPGYRARLDTAARLVDTAITQIRQGILRKRKLVWLELTGCSGNIISLLDGSNPDFKYLISQMTDFIFNNSLSVSEGQKAMDQLFSVLGSDFILGVEGAVATKNNGLYNIIGRRNGKPITALEAVKTLGEKATHVIAIGACATHGGFSAARPNPAGCVGIQRVLNRKVIKLTGCPCHPDWFMGTLAHILLYGEPELDSTDRPLLFYSTLIHDRCPRRSYFDRGIFAEKLGDKTCMFKLGCRGPVTRTDCPVRQWNQYVNWPIRDDTPCIGCAAFGFPDAMEPFISYNTTREVKNDKNNY
ncbi:MAG: hydrogenase small subunit [Thermoclostridium sp.]|nr:hydrogenase small subunit [Thermoclostridium sp.]